MILSAIPEVPSDCFKPVHSLLRLLILQVIKSVGINVKKTIEIDGKFFEIEVKMGPCRFETLFINKHLINFRYLKLDFSRETTLTDIKLCSHNMTYAFWSEDERIALLCKILLELYN